MIDPAAFDARCERCPRLASFLREVRAEHRGYHGRPVAPFGAESAALLVVGLAPGLHGANRTGRPFTGDHAGILLYETLHAAGLANRPQSVALGDGLELLGVRITNAVKCLPPANKPLPAEIRSCNTFLRTELAAAKSLRVMLALGRIAHDAILQALALPRAQYSFAHGAEHWLPDGRMLIDSFHCSRYNTQTRRLTPEMFRRVVFRARDLAGVA
jgi:uracil-DNA glycosylase